jgi:autonomous glycyl radical cofactor GrcA
MADQAGWRGCGAFLRGRLAAALAGLVLVVCLLAPAPARAEGPNFALQTLDPAEKPYFVLETRPGRVIERRVRVINVGETRGAVRLYAVDATTGATTGAVYRQDREARRGVGRWTTLAEDELVLDPGERAVVPIRIRVPRRVRGGHHLGGIVAENRTLQESSKRHGKGRTLRVRVRNLTVLAVQLNLPAPRVERLTIDGAWADRVGTRQAIRLALVNRGNRLIKGEGEMIVTEDGRRVATTRFPVDTFVPRTSARYPVVLDGRPLPAGRYDLETVIRYGDDQVARYSTRLKVSEAQARAVIAPGAAVVPPAAVAGGPSLLQLMIGGAALLAVGFLAATVLFRRRARSDAAP